MIHRKRKKKAKMHLKVMPIKLCNGKNQIQHTMHKLMKINPGYPGKKYFTGTELIS